MASKTVINAMITTIKIMTRLSVFFNFYSYTVVGDDDDELVYLYIGGHTNRLDFQVIAGGNKTSRISILQASPLPTFGSHFRKM